MQPKDIVAAVRALALPRHKYVVVGSAIMAMHGLRQAVHDLDLLVEPELMKELVRDGWQRKWFFRGMFRSKCAESGIFQAFTSMRHGSFRKSNREIIMNAEIIDGIPFMSLCDLRDFKLAVKRRKDLDDVVLIERSLYQGNIEFA